MTEEEAQGWLEARGWWSGQTGDRLRHFIALVLDEADRQNLISDATRGIILSRHVVDSAQLIGLAAPQGRWVDLGTGAGFPGMVVACLLDIPVEMVEMRPRRAAFLSAAAQALGLRHVRVHTAKVEAVRINDAAATISARAYAPLDRLFRSARHLSDLSTVWVLPKGRNGEKELETARREWQAVFHVERSITDPESIIVRATELEPREQSVPRCPPPRSRRQKSR